MSAYIESKEHIDVLVELARRHSIPYGLTWYEREPTGAADEDALLTRVSFAYGDDWDIVGQMLTNENVRSVSYRYNESPWTNNLPGPIDSWYLVPYRFKSPQVDITPVEGLMALSGYEYQSCEHPQWRQSEAYSFCQALQRALIRALPGYDAAPWAWDAEEVAKRSRVISLMDLSRSRP